MTDTPKPKQAREFWVSEHGGGASIDWDGPPNYTKDYYYSGNKVFHVIEYFAYEQAIKERDDILERYRAIELANKEMSRNDHVHFGSLLQERNKLREQLKDKVDLGMLYVAESYQGEVNHWRSMAEKLAEALKKADTFMTWLCEDSNKYPGTDAGNAAKLERYDLREALAEFEAGKK